MENEQSFRIDKHRAPDLLENYGIPSDPQERKKFEADKMAAFRNQQGSQAPQPQQPAAPIPPNERVFLVNNLPRPIHIPDEQIKIDGQLAVSAQGPFAQMSREELNNSYQLQTYMTTPISTIKGHPLCGVPRVQQIDEATFRKLYNEYRKKKVIREREYSRNHSTINHMGDGSLDEFDAAQEVTKVRPNIIRAQG